MRHLILVLFCCVTAWSQDAAPPVDWSAIDRQVAVLRRAVDARDLDAVKKASEDLSTVTSAEWAKGRTPADYLRLAEARVSAQPASRTMTLPYLAILAAQAGAWDKARNYAQDALAAGPSPAYDTVHLANNVLGLVALHDNDVPSAEMYLLPAGRSKGLARMKRWGPTLALAKALLDKGRNDVVAEYLQLCRGFITDNPKLELWIATLKGGHAPDLTREYLWYI